MRIYVVLGTHDQHLGLLEAMHSLDLFSRESEEEYFVVGVGIEPWEPEGESVNRLLVIFFFKFWSFKMRESTCEASSRKATSRLRPGSKKVSRSPHSFHNLF